MRAANAENALAKEKGISYMDTPNNQLSFVQLENIDELSGAQIAKVAELIYDTDPYIYPTMFHSKEEATRIIPAMIAAEDAMFNPGNLFVAFLEDRVLGILLWHLGAMDWKKDVYLQCMEEHELAPVACIDRIESECFSGYASTSPDAISIVNLCVDTDARGMGIGGRLMSAFFESTVGQCREYQLLVLEENTNAVGLYKKLGFAATCRTQGFSEDLRDLPCLKMIRQSKG